MSTLGSVSGKAQREQRLLGKLNEALLALEVDALGRCAEFDITEDEVQKSRHVLLEFASRLRSELGTQITSTDFRSLVGRLRTGMKPLDDWREDLDGLIGVLITGRRLDEEALPILEELLSLLDEEFSRDLKRLYRR